MDPLNKHLKYMEIFFVLNFSSFFRPQNSHATGVRITQFGEGEKIRTVCHHEEDTKSWDPK